MEEEILPTVAFASIGDIGIDHFISSGKKLPGGMALNSAYHAQKAGAQASIVSAVGDDADGISIIDFVTKHGVSTRALEKIQGSTDKVEITLDADARPVYGTWDLGVLTDYRLTSFQKNYLWSQDVVITVHLPELRGMFDDVARCSLPDTLKVGDFTDLSEYQGDMGILSQYRGAFDVFVVSIDEDIDSRRERLKEFVEEEKAMGIALLGAQGSCVYFHGREYYRKTESVPVVDTTGAGDAYLATFLVEYYRDRDISSAMGKATQKASMVIQTHGAIA